MIGEERVPPAPLEEDNYDLDDLDEELANLDCSKDFSLWSSFRKSKSISVSSSRQSDGSFAKAAALVALQEEEETLTKEEREDLEAWNLRLKREEVFSHRYRPTEEETVEMRQLMKFLGLSKKGLLSRSLSDLDDTAAVLLFNKEPPRSILLKRGPVLCDGQERELILLTHGFVLAKISDNVKSSPRLFSMARTYDQCALYTSVRRVIDLWEDEANGQYWFSVHTSDQEFFVFSCSTLIHKRAWLDAWERAVVQDRMHSPDNNNNALGWQHAMLQTSLHAAAVTGDEGLLVEAWLEHKNRVDAYQKFTPLHYAVLCDNYNVAEFLLRHGADPEVQDPDGRTPMYYAHRDERTDLVELLEDFGAKKSKQTEEEERSELFRDVADFEARKEWEHEREQTARTQDTAVQGAKGSMNDAMNAMRERGQKIETLEQKTRNLQEETKTYGDLARQLKEKTKKKKWYQL